ncbi:MAG: aminotransferase class V-fold PLP-dependent enzyme [Clostridia bacterium]|nr:aminotransferase class V-fold PLP-dependent enzyme [Clostridia bacterium]
MDDRREPYFAQAQEGPLPEGAVGRGLTGNVTTPICDFVRAYAAKAPVRLHMPGHKGSGLLGVEALDITEIDGADELYAAGGIIAESEANASALFGAPTFYAAGGSSMAIRAMLLLALEHTGGVEGATVLAGRNAHRAFVSAAALLGFDVAWLWPSAGAAYHCCDVTAGEVEAALEGMGGRCRVVYLTSPDYLGHIPDLAAIAKACHRHGALLLVDGAHGAYLRFLRPSIHPMDLGADLCCASAHKTLPALTGAAYLHLRPGLDIDARRVKAALALFGSSSPSWLILQSLDACNPYLETLPDRLAAFLPELDGVKAALVRHGYALTGDEPMKLTIRAGDYGATGDALAAALIEGNIYPEFHDPDFLTLMPTPANAGEDLRRLEDALLSVPRREAVFRAAPPFHAPVRALSIREAALAPRETLPVDQCAGRVLAESALSCPPCVPIAVCGEVIDAETIQRLRFYGIRACAVVR